MAQCTGNTASCHSYHNYFIAVCPFAILQATAEQQTGYPANISFIVVHAVQFLLAMIMVTVFAITSGGFRWAA